MKPKTLVTFALLAFVAAAVVTLAVQSKRNSEPVETSVEASSDSTATTMTEQSNQDGVLVYYFHGDVRCVTCNKLEAYSEEAIREAFPDQLTSGRMTWRAVNVSQGENKHFVQDFQLTNKALVLAEYRDGQMARWKNLERIWELVDDKDEYLSYVKQSTRAFLQES